MFTQRKLYESVLEEINKHKSPAFYPDTFNYYINKSIQDWANQRYAQYSISQQLDDDLQNLLRVVKITNDHPYPMNILDKKGNHAFINTNISAPAISTGIGSYRFDYQPDPLNPNMVQLRYFALFGGVSKYKRITFTLDPIDDGYDAIYFSNIDVPNTGDGITTSWMDNVEFNEVIRANDMIIGINGDRVQINNSILKTVNRENIPFSFRLNSQANSHTILNGETIFFKYNINNGMFEQLSEDGYVNITDNELDVLTPPDYFHLIELAIKYKYKNKPECEKWKYKTVSASRLTADRDAQINNNAYLKPKSNRPYFKIENDIVSNKALLALELGMDIKEGLMELDGIVLKYLKTPEKIHLDDMDIELEEDRTELIEFQDYVCYELIERCVTLFLEKTGSPRIQTQPVVSDSNRMSREAGVGAAKK